MFIVETCFEESDVLYLRWSQSSLSSLASYTSIYSGELNISRGNDFSSAFVLTPSKSELFYGVLGYFVSHYKVIFNFLGDIFSVTLMALQPVSLEYC